MSTDPSPVTTITPWRDCASASPRPSPGPCPIAAGTYEKSSGVSESDTHRSTEPCVVRTICCPRSLASTSRASQCVIATVTDCGPDTSNGPPDERVAFSSKGTRAEGAWLRKNRSGGLLRAIDRVAAAFVLLQPVEHVVTRYNTRGRFYR